MSDRVAPAADDVHERRDRPEAHCLVRWLPAIALAAALAALLVAGWSSFRVHLLAPERDGDDADASRTRVCAAFDVVSTAVPLRTNEDLGPGEVAGAAVAANARLALLGGGTYLLNVLEPGTPDQLATYVRSIAHDLQDVGINALAGADNRAVSQTVLMANIEQTRKQIANMCK